MVTQAAAASDVGNMPETSSSAAGLEVAVAAQPQASTAGDALLAAQLQEEDQVRYLLPGCLHEPVHVLIPVSKS